VAVTKVASNVEKKVTCHVNALKEAAVVTGIVSNAESRVTCLVNAHRVVGPHLEVADAVSAVVEVIEDVVVAEDAVELLGVEAAAVVVV